MHRGDAQRPDAIFQASHTSKSYTNPTPPPTAPLYPAPIFRHMPTAFLTRRIPSNGGKLELTCLDRRFPISSPNVCVSPILPRLPQWTVLMPRGLLSAGAQDACG